MLFEDAVDPELLRAMVLIREFLADMEVNPHKLDLAKRHYENALGDFQFVRRYHNLYVLDLLTPAGADYFLQAADDNEHLFEANLEEEASYRIPEIVLLYENRLSDYTRLAERIGSEVLWPLFQLMYGNAPNDFTSIQLARYEAPDNLGTGWHCDVASEASCVVSLAPERHVGGGTLIMPHGVFGPPFHLQPLLKGQALLFNGRTTLHRGLEVESGQRNLLVYWMTNLN